MHADEPRSRWTGLVRETFRSGTVAGLAMMPFGWAFRAAGLRVNAYGRKTLELLVGADPPWPFLLNFVQHMIISWIAAVPLIVALKRFASRRSRFVVGVVYGLGFYVVLNSLALPIAFGDATPWQLGFSTVYPSLAIHVVYGGVIGWMAMPTSTDRTTG